MQNVMRREAQRSGDARSFPKRATVSAYDPAHYAAKVIIQPEGYETGFLPIGTPWVGVGWGLFCPPSPGDEVDVHFQEGGKNAAYISLRFYGDQAAPLSVSSGEFWLVHASGSLIKMTNDGKALINGHVEIDFTGPTVNITATTAVNVTAPAINLGSAGETLRGLVNDAMETLYNTHTHPAPNGTTGVPNQQMDSTQITTVVKAG